MKLLTVRLRYSSAWPHSSRGCIRPVGSACSWPATSPLACRSVSPGVLPFGNWGPRRFSRHSHKVRRKFSRWTGRARRGWWAPAARAPAGESERDCSAARRPLLSGSRPPWRYQFPCSKTYWSSFPSCHGAVRERHLERHRTGKPKEGAHTDVHEKFSRATRPRKPKASEHNPTSETNRHGNQAEIALTFVR